MILGDHIDFENAQGVDLNNPRSDFASAMESLAVIMDLEPEIIVPGHGEVLAGRARVQHALEEVRSFDQELPETLVALLSKRPRSLKELTYQTFEGITISIEGMTMMVVLNVLLYLEREGLVHRIGKPGRLLWKAR